MSSGDTLLIFTALSAEPTLNLAAGLGQYVARPAVLFDKALVSEVCFAGVLPEHYRGGGFEVDIHWLPATTTALAWTEAGDTAGALSSWSITGGTAANTDQWKLYWNLTVAGGNSTVSLYKDSAKTQLVAQGSVNNAAGGSITLAQQNSSGLSGSVTVAAGALADTDTNTLTANRVLWGVSIERIDHDGTQISSDSFATEAQVYAAPCATAGKVRYTTVSLADGAAIDSLAVGEGFRLKLRRVATDAGDDLDDAACVLFVHVREG